MLEIHGLSAGYGDALVLRDVDLRAERGELIAIIGPNGCGKTTLLRAISGVIPARSGLIALDGVDVKQIQTLAREVAVVAQTAAVPERFTAFELAMMGRTPHLRLLQSESRRDVDIVRQAMQRADCWQLRDRFVEELSGGERQRVLIARALAQQPRLLLLDEPTSHLDLKHQVATFQLTRDLCAADGMAAVAVVHDVTLASMFADRIALMSSGTIVACGAPGDVLRAPLLERVYDLPVRVLQHPVTGLPIIVPEPVTATTTAVEAAS